MRAIYAAKGRPPSNPLIVHVLGEEQARPLCDRWPLEARLLARRFWPGPLTLVLPRSALVPDEVTAGGETVAVRAPSHPDARALLSRLSGAPLAGPSANRAGHVSPTTAAHVLRDLNGRIDAVLDGGRCAFGIESTVVALLPVPRLLRVGAISRSALEDVVGLMESGALPPGIAQSPGQQRRHYAPAGRVLLVEAARLGEATRGAGRVGAIVHSAPGPAALLVKHLPANAAGYARELYAALRDLEDADCATIVIEEVPRGSEWDAIRDRLSRAAAI